MPFTVIRYTERPELWENTDAISEEVWPEYNLNGEVLGRYWERLFEEFPEYQFALYDMQAQEVIAEGHTAPCDWDGTSEGLGDGIDATIVAAFEARADGRAPTALCALAAEIRPRFQGGGLADRMLEVMSDIGRDAGLAHLIAPVRPSRKDRYPITPIEDYVAWTREDGAPFDPWIRVHVRRGGRSPGRSRARCTSSARSPTGSGGPGCGSRATGSTRSRPVWRLSRSTTVSIAARTGSRASGSSTRSDRTESRTTPVVRAR